MLWCSVSNPDHSVIDVRLCVCVVVVNEMLVLLSSSEVSGLCDVKR